jgi:hypothetical protein
VEKSKWKIQPQQILRQIRKTQIRNRLFSSCAKWGKFSEQDVFALKGRADLVSQVVAKYGVPQVAQTQVHALLKGRAFGAGA